MGIHLGKTACIHEDCDSSDGLGVYIDEEGKNIYSGYCFVCGESFLQEQLEEEGIIVNGEFVGNVYSRHSYRGGKVKKEKFPLTQEEVLTITSSGRFDTSNYRKLSEKVNEKYGVTSVFNDAGELTHRYYPITRAGAVVGFKGRELPKAFFSKGLNDNTCELFGQSLFRAGGKRLLIVGGEEDALAGYEILRSDQIRRGKKHLDAVAVVSPSVGETGCVKQLQANYEWISSFEEIVVMMDNDEAGEEATKKILKVLPMGKVKVSKLPLKDPCEMLKHNREAEFVRIFYDAKKDSPAGIVGSGGLREKIMARAKLEKVPLPPFASKLQKMMAGGIPLGYIVNIASASGQGKSTLVNEFIYYWIFNSPYKVGVVSLESDPGEYGELLLSRHVGQKLALFETVDSKVSYLNSHIAQEGMDELFFTEDGDDRFHVVDHQGSVGEDELKAKCEYLVRGLGCKLIVVDPLTLALTGGSNDDIDEFMSWQKKFVDQHQCVFINVTHVRKNSNDQKANSKGASISEESIKGSGSIFQVAGSNILLMRDKENEDAIVRNTTKVVQSKCRWTGITGPAGNWYYDNQKHTLYDYETYFAAGENPEYSEQFAEQSLMLEAGGEEAVSAIESGGVAFMTPS